jgi:hypothetical protein
MKSDAERKVRQTAIHAQDLMIDERPVSAAVVKTFFSA